MTKQEFLAFSLPYKLAISVISPFNSERRFEEWLTAMNYDQHYQTATSKPILHPLSDLTKEIEHKGEKFVPTVKLSKMSYPNHEWKLSSSGLYACVGNGYMTFEYNYGYNCFLCNNSAQLAN